MTLIKASCPTCGDFEGTADQFRIIDWGDWHRLTAYEYRCPHCLQVQRKPADPETVRLLKTGHVPVVTVPAAAGIDPDAAPLTRAEVYAALEQLHLDDTDPLDELERPA